MNVIFKATVCGLAVFSVIFTSQCFAAAPVKYNKIITRLTVTTRLAEWDDKIRNGMPPYNRKIEDMDYHFFAARVDDWIKSPDLELNSRITKDWYIKLKNNLLAMAKLMRYIDLSKVDGRGKVSAARVAKKEQEMKKAYNEFTELRKNPVMITQKRLKFLKRQKALKEKRRK